MLVGMFIFLVYELYIWKKTGYPPGISKELIKRIEQEEHNFIHRQGEEVDFTHLH